MHFWRRKNSHIKSSITPHFRLPAQERIKILADAFEELWPDISSVDPLSFMGVKPYTDSIKKDQEKTGLSDGVVCGRAKIGDFTVALAVMDFEFMGGSMGSVVGEKITRTIELATKEKLPLIIVCSSGGARMQEGMISLLQMAKTSSAIADFKKIGHPYISVLTDPTTGGVMASFASLADIIIAEPRSQIGFAGERVILQTMKQKLPEGFQTAEFCVDHGLIDMVVQRTEMKGRIIALLEYMHGKVVDKNEEPSLVERFQKAIGWNRKENGSFKSRPTG